MVLDTWWFHLQHICLPTTIFVLTMQGGCVGVIYITVKLKRIKLLQHKGVLSIQVVSDMFLDIFTVQEKLGCG